jgi:hypothetical protein
MVLRQIILCRPEHEVAPATRILTLSDDAVTRLSSPSPPGDLCLDAEHCWSDSLMKKQQLKQKADSRGDAEEYGNKSIFCPSGYGVKVLP